MTPEELDAIESRMAKAFPAIDYKRDSDTDMPALCAALRAAWAERDGARADNESLESALADAREDLEAQTNLAHFTLANAKDAMAERDAAIKERDEARRCQALTMEALNAVNRDLTAMQVQRYREELAKARPVSWASDSTTLRDAITDAPNPEK